MRKLLTLAILLFPAAALAQAAPSGSRSPPVAQQDRPEDMAAFQAHQNDLLRALFDRDEATIQQMQRELTTANIALMEANKKLAEMTKQAPAVKPTEPEAGAPPVEAKPNDR